MKHGSRAGGCSSVVEHVLSICEALSSVSSMGVGDGVGSLDFRC